jgi:hypothetical protein
VSVEFRQSDAEVQRRRVHGLPGLRRTVRVLLDLHWLFHRRSCQGIPRNKRQNCTFSCCLCDPSALIPFKFQLAAVEPWSDRHRHKLVWGASPRQEDGGLWLLLCERHRPGDLGALEVPPTCAVHRHRHPPRGRSGGGLLHH